MCFTGLAHCPLWLVVVCVVGLCSFFVESFKGCPTNWYAASDELCYRNVFPVATELKTYEQAEQLCRMMDSRSILPKIHTLRDWSTLKEFAYLINHGDLFKFWLKKEKKSLTTSSNCEITWGVKNQRFNSVPCTDKYDVLCQLNLTLPAPEVTKYHCPPGWYLAESGKCYLSPHRQLKTFPDAVKECKKEHPDANVPLFGLQVSDEFRQYVEEVYGAVWPKSWMRGLSNSDTPVIGSLCPVSVSPTIKFVSEVCVAANYVVCEMDGTPLYNQSSDDLGNESCPVGWTFGTNNTCYRDPSAVMGRKTRSYFQATQDCATMHPDSTLPQIGDGPGEWKIFANIVKGFNSQVWPNLWIAGRRTSEKDPFYNGSGEDLTEIYGDYFAAGEPLAVPSYQCVRSTMEKGELRATDCFAKLNVVCQLKVSLRSNKKSACPAKWFTGKNVCYKVPYGIQKNRQFPYAAADSVCSKHSIDHMKARLPSFEANRVDEGAFINFLELINRPTGWVNVWMQNDEVGNVKQCPATLNSEGRTQKSSCKATNAAVCQIKRTDSDLELQAPPSIEELIPSNNVGSVCPSGWYSGKGKFCYRALSNLNTKMMDYFAAEQRCSQLHSSATLPRFLNRDQWDGFQDFVFSRNNGKWARIWMHREKVDASEMEVWNNFDGDNELDTGKCAVTWNLDGRWKSVNCSPGLNNGVCQLDANDLVDNGELQGNIKAKTYKCPVGWYVAMDGNCYIKPSTQLVTKLKAEELCRKLHPSATLPFFAEEKNWMSFREFIMSINRGVWLHSWLNGNDVDREGTWTMDKTEKPFNFTNWYASEPNGGISSNCLTSYVVEGQWSDELCGSVHYYTCQLNNKEYVKSRHSKIRNNGGTCPSGWIVGLGNTCYFAPFKLNVELKSQDEAKKACAEAHPRATLPRLGSQREWLAMGKLLTRMNSDAWAIVWLDGEAESMKKVFEFGNGDTLKFKRWLPGYPTAQPIETCVVATDRVGRWINLPCTGVQNVLCQLRMGEEDSEGHPYHERDVPVGKQLGLCPFGWTFMEGICYRAPFSLRSTYSFSKQEAVELCTTEQASSHLSLFQDASEWNAFENFISRIDRGAWKRMWLGGTDDIFEGRFVHDVSLDTLNYTNWNPGKPLGMKGIDCIATIGAKGKWTDENCDTKLKVVCQVTQNEFLKELIATVTENQRRLSQTTTAAPVPIGTTSVPEITDEYDQLSRSIDKENSDATLENLEPSEPDKTTESQLSQERTFEESTEFLSGLGGDISAEISPEKSQEIEKELVCTDDNGNLWNNEEVFFFGNLEVSCNIDAESKTTAVKVLQCCEEQAVHCIPINSKAVSNIEENQWFECTERGGKYVEDLTLSQTTTPTTPAPVETVTEANKREPGCYDDLGGKREVGDYFVYGTYVVECMDYNPQSSQPIKINSCCESETNLCTPLLSIAESIQYPGFYVQCRDSGSNYVNKPCTDDQGKVVANNGTMHIDNLVVRCETDAEFDESYFTVEECCEMGPGKCVPLDGKSESTKYPGFEYECTSRGFIYDLIAT